MPPRLDQSGMASVDSASARAASQIGLKNWECLPPWLLQPSVPTRTATRSRLGTTRVWLLFLPVDQ